MIIIESNGAGRRLPGGLLAIILLLVLVPVSRADDSPPGVATFLLKSGETVEATAFEVNGRFRTVALETPEGERNVSFQDIVSVHEAGRDITAEILGGVTGETPAGAPEVGGAGKPAAERKPPGEVEPATGEDPESETVPAGRGDGAAVSAAPEENWESERSPSHVRRNLSPYSMGLRAAGNYSIPMGDYYEGIGAGPGYEGDLVIGVKRDIALRLSVSRAGLDPDFSLPFPPEPIRSEEWSMSAWRFTFGAQYQRPLSRGNRDGSLAFLYTGIGAIVQTLEWDVNLVGGENISDSYDETKLLTTFGGGMWKMFSESMGFDLSAEFGVVWIGTTSDSTYSYYGNTQTALLFDLKAGLVMLFR